MDINIHSKSYSWHGLNYKRKNPSGLYGNGREVIPEITIYKQLLLRNFHHSFVSPLI